MTKLPLPALLLLAASAGSGFAASPFTCKASGDAWSVEGAPARKAACLVRCILRDSAGTQDTVSCSPTVSPGGRSTPVCEGFLLGRHWSTATLVSSECASVEP